MGIVQSTGKNPPKLKIPGAIYEMGLEPGACGLYDFTHLLAKPIRQKRKFSNSSVTFQNDDRQERLIKAIQHFLIAIREVSVTSVELKKVSIEVDVSFSNILIISLFSKFTPFPVISSNFKIKFL